MTVTHHVQDAVGVITLDRPEKRNALNSVMIDGISAALLAHEADPAVRAIVIAATGDRAFCAGMDLSGVGGKADATRDPIGPQTYQRLMKEGGRKPLVAAVNGAALAGGFELMMACDLVVAADHAIFGLPEVARGLVAGAGGTFLPTRIPRAIAYEILLTAQHFDAQRALELGLVNRVTPLADVFDTALELARAVAQNSPNAVRVTRGLLRDAIEIPAAEAWENVNGAIAEIFASPDAVEGSRAFLERRTPNWA